MPNHSQPSRDSSPGGKLNFHPSHQELRGFIVGKLDEAASERIEAHLAACSACNQVLERTDRGDALVDLVRFAESGDDPVFTRQYEPVASGPVYIEGYEIETELGRGGLGVVYRARHLGLKRSVALKVISSGQHACLDQRRRFTAEAKTIAKLRHPGIVQIYEVGEEQGRPYLALELIEGGGLQAYTKEAPQDPIWAARLVAQIARTMHYAHEQGIVHRDLKPANILLDDAGEASGKGNPPSAKITDFGLAKDLATDTNVTRTGVVMGTPGYLAPEQATGNPRDVTAAADIYSLGAILYELLTGRPPLVADDVVETIRMVREVEPAPPRRLQPGIPRDLQTICLKCLEKELQRRYATAAELANDLDRYLHNEPISAQPASALRRAALTYRRNRTVTHLVGGFVAALVAGVIAYGVHLNHTNNLLASTNTQLMSSNAELAVKTEEALAAREASVRNALAATEQEARAVRERDEARRLLRIATARGMAAQSIGEQERDPILGLLLAREAVQTTQRSGDSLLPVAFEQLLSSVARTGGQSVQQDKEVERSVVYAPAGLMAAFGRDNQVKLWDLRAKSPEESPLLLGKFPPLSRMAFSRDGQRFAISNYVGHGISVWNLPPKDRESLFKRSDSQTPLQCTTLPIKWPHWHLAISPNGRWLAAAGREDKIRLWDLDAEDPVQSLVELQGGVSFTGMRFDPQNRFLVSVKHQVVRLWKLDGERIDPQPTTTMNWPEKIARLKISSDGKWLGLICMDRAEVKLLKVSEDAVVSQPHDWALPHEFVHDIEFGNTGRWLASSGGDETWKLWDLDRISKSKDRPVTFRSRSGPIHMMVFSRDDRYVATKAAHEYKMCVWNLSAPRRRPAVLRGHRDGIRQASFDNEGNLYVEDHTGYVRRWSPDDYLQRAYPIAFDVNRNRIECTAFTPDGNLIVSPLESPLSVWNLKNVEQPLATFADESYATCAQASADGKWLAQATRSGSVLLRRLHAGIPAEEAIELKVQNSTLFTVAFSPNSKMFAAAGVFGKVRIWSVPEGDSDPVLVKEIRTSSRSVRALDFSPDGRLLATGHIEGDVRVWNVEEAQGGEGMVATVRGHSSGVEAIKFNPIGGQFASSSSDGKVTLWNLNDTGGIVSHVDLLGHVGKAMDLSYRSDGKQLASAGLDESVWLWNLTARDPVASAIVLREFDSPVYTVDFSPNDQYLVTGSRSGRIVAWDLRVDALMAEAARVAGRELTEAERKRCFDLSAQPD